MSITESHTACCDDQGTIVRERNRYFTGKFMTARDLSLEQTYFLQRHRLANRLLHGWGIVCGLAVKAHPVPKCAHRWLVVCGGVALDCHGRELILPRDQAFELPLPTQPSECEADLDHPPPEELLTQPALLCLRYHEEAVEEVAAIHGDVCDPGERQANRIRESAVLELCPLESFPHCWPPVGKKTCEENKTGCHAGRGCLQPDCPCGDCVPLAKIIPRQTEEEGWRFEVETLHRKYLPAAPECLTRICGINWDHGGAITLSQLNEELEGQFVIQFDRPLRREESNNQRGVNAFTFQVTFENLQHDRETLPFHKDNPPYLSEDGCQAVYQVSPYFLDGLAECDVYISLKCDFIADCHDRPVDGNHMLGTLPSGNGTPGGTFESWFRLIAEPKAKRRKS